MTRPLLTNIQILRFFAAAAVLVGHAGDLFLPGNSYWRSIPWSGGVDIFFVISSFVMTYLTQGQFGQAGASRAFVTRRIIRIVPPYWLFTTLTVATVLLFGEHVRNTQLSAQTVVTSYLFIPWPRADGELNPLLSQGWTLNYEAFFYVVFALALFMKRGLALLAGLFVLLAVIRPAIPVTWFVPRFWTDPIILEFLGGIGLAIVYLRGHRLPFWGSLLLLLTAIAVFVLTERVEPSAIRRVIHAGLPALMVCASLALSPEPASEPGFFRRALVLGGDSSYTLYLSHTFALNAALIAWRHAGSPQPAIALTLACGAAIAASILFYRMFERPMTDALHRLAGDRPVRGAAAVAP